MAFIACKIRFFLLCDLTWMDLLGWLLTSSDLVLPWSLVLPQSSQSVMPLSQGLCICSSCWRARPKIISLLASFFHCVHTTMLTPVRGLSCLTKSSAFLFPKHSPFYITVFGHVMFLYYLVGLFSHHACGGRAELHHSRRHQLYLCPEAPLQRLVHSRWSIHFFSMENYDSQVDMG